MSRPSSFAGSLAGARGARASQAPRTPSPLLDDFAHRPAFAGWTGGRLNSFYSGNIIRIRRASDDAEIDVGCVAGTNRLDTAAVAAHCAGTTGTLVKLYDQSGNGYDLAQATAGLQAVVYASGALVTGAGGYLAAKFGLDAQYEVDMALVGDIDLTLAYDVKATAGTTDNWFMAGLLDGSIGGAGAASFFSDAWLDTNQAPLYVYHYTNDGLDTFLDSGAGYFPGPITDLTRWYQFTRRAGNLLSQDEGRVDGTVVAFDDVYNDQTPNLADSELYWGGWANNGTKGCTASAMLLWDSVLDATEQAAFDAFMEAVHV